MAPANIKISYAERGGELVHISAFDKGGLKPDCFCLVCKKSLIARIGKQRVPHFAHPADVQSHVRAVGLPIFTGGAAKHKRLR